MNYQEVLSAAKKNFKGRCRVCPVCNGVACAGEIPGVGGLRTGRSFKRNYEAWQKWGIVMQSMAGIQEPALTGQFLGETLELPVMLAPIGGVPLNLTDTITEEEYCEAICMGAYRSGTLAFTGDSGAPGVYDAGLAQLGKTDGKMIPTIKPREDDKIIEFAQRAIAGGAMAVACDIDAAVLVNMRLFGQPVEPKTAASIAKITKELSVPFIVKGIMSGAEALACYEAGAAAVVISNHGGRIMDGMAGTADVLPEVASKVKGKLPIIVDGGIRTGEEVFKALALGADFVLIGRPAMIAAAGGGIDGVALVLAKIKQELRDAMMMTGCVTLADIDKSKLLLLE